jgi:hypothetical protein
LVVLQIRFGAAPLGMTLTGNVVTDVTFPSQAFSHGVQVCEQCVGE